MKVTELKGIGPKTAGLFEKLGLFDAEDLLRYYPLHYDYFESPRPLGRAVVGEKGTFKGIIAREVVVRPAVRGTVTTTVIEDPTGRLRLTWFNAPYIRPLLKRGSVFLFRGLISRRGAELVLEHPAVYSSAKYGEVEGTLVPVYGLTKGLSNGAVIRAVRQALDLLPKEEEYLPERLLLPSLGIAEEAAALLPEAEAIPTIHFPANAPALLGAQKRLAFDELFSFVLAIRHLRQMTAEAGNDFPMKPLWSTEEAIESLPYQLTRAQLRVFREIEEDLCGRHPMARLVQGDVGSGKTILAFLAMRMTAENGYQSVLLAPTEVLARQHFEKLLAFSTSNPAFSNVRPAFLSGSMRAGERKRTLAAIASGEANAIVGTHALLTESVCYQKLALVITDEQHRFGVRQRKALTERGSRPHTLVMSATPIPRTLGIIWFGDLAISVIDELPASRLRIKTAVVDETWREKADRFLGRELQTGHQAYVICPMIEPGEETGFADVESVARRLKKTFPEYPVGTLHGRMRGEEKEKAMAAFAEGKTRILVSTTVVEVGVDVPNATVILVENAERFGLATLHQLRGRVGRGAAQSYCILMKGSEGEAAEERLAVLRESNDGFKIAEEDFRLRGTGDLLGVRQSGDMRFLAADLSRDGDMLRLAGTLAAQILQEDPSLEREENARVRDRLEAYLASEERTDTL